MTSIVKFISLFLFMSMVILSGIVRAQETGFARQGVVEMSGSVSFSSIAVVNGDKTSDATTLFSFGPQIGYFVIDGLEIGLRTGISLLPGFTSISPPNSDATTVVQLFFSPSYNFRLEKSNVYPFAEAQLGYTSMSTGGSTVSGFSYGGRVGIKFDPVKHMLLSIYGEYLWITMNPSQQTSSVRNGFNYFTFGVSVGAYF